MNMEEDEVALDKAIESGDTDLIFFVLLHLKKKLPGASFFRMINNRPVASALVESSARAQDRELLKDMYYQDDRPVDGSDLLFEDAMQQDLVQAKIDKLRLAARLLADAKDPNATLHNKALAESAQLLKMQEAFDKDITDNSGSYVGLSVNETMFRLIRSGYSKRAAKVQSEFKVPEKTWWWVRLRALVAARLFGELEEVGKNRKSPIGWQVWMRFHSIPCLIHPSNLMHHPMLTTSITAAILQRSPQRGQQSPRRHIHPQMHQPPAIRAHRHVGEVRHDCPCRRRSPEGKGHECPGTAP